MHTTTCVKKQALLAAVVFFQSCQCTSPPSTRKYFCHNTPEGAVLALSYAGRTNDLDYISDVVVVPKDHLVNVADCLRLADILHQTKILSPTVDLISNTSDEMGYAAVKLEFREKSQRYGGMEIVVYTVATKRIDSVITWLVDVERSLKELKKQLRE